MKNKILEFVVAVAMVASASAAFAEAGVALPIRNRIQGMENDGYCGEASVQECALYYGIYASQAYIRGIFDPTQREDLVELDKFALVFEKLGLKADYFPTASVPVPQYRVFEVWAKKQLARRWPVITGCYTTADPGSQLQFDHIVTITSFISRRLGIYDDNDMFTVNEHYPPGSAHSIAAKWSFDTRRMEGPGAIYGYAIPKEVNYGIAITGTSNRDRSALPVSVELDRIDEPNLIVGRRPVMCNAEITVRSLTPGVSYVLCRYNDPARVPLRNLKASSADAHFAFKARSASHVINDSISSDGIAIYRCVPASR